MHRNALLRQLMAVLMTPLVAACSSSATDSGDGPRIDGIEFSAFAAVVSEAQIRLSVTTVNATTRHQSVDVLGGGCIVRRVVWYESESEPILDDRMSTLPCQMISEGISLSPGDSRELPDTPLEFDLGKELGDDFRSGTYRVAGVIRSGGENLIIPAGSIDLP